MVYVLLLIVGFITLVWSADRFLSGAASTASHLGVSKLLIGLTVVSVGTSAPEILVSLAASLDGSPLIAGAKSGDLNVVEFLVAAGADVNMIVPGDENPLMAASEHGNLEIVQFLTDKGADVHVKVREHGKIRTALSQARKRGHQDVVDYLISRGARE